MQEYRDAAGVDEGMTGTSTRFAFKILSETFNFDSDEVAADPVHLMYVLEQAIKRDQFPTAPERSVDHTSELPHLMRISNAVFFLNQKNCSIKISHISPRL